MHCGSLHGRDVAASEDEYACSHILRQQSTIALLMSRLPSK